MYFKVGLRAVGLWERLSDELMVILCIWPGDFLLVALGAGPSSTWSNAVFDWRAWGSSWHLSDLVPCTLKQCHLPGVLWHSNCIWLYVCKELIGIANMAVAGFALFTSLSLDKSLNCIPKISPEGSFPYLATDSYLKANIKVLQSQFIILLYWLTCPIMSHQLIHPSTDSPHLLKNTLLNKTPVACSQSLPDSEPGSQFHDCSSGALNLLSAVVSEFVLYSLWGAPL